MDLCEFGVVAKVPDSTVSLSLRVIKYQLNSSLLNTATMFWAKKKKKEIKKG